MPTDSPHKPWVAILGPSRNVFQDLEGASHLQRGPPKRCVPFVGAHAAAYTWWLGDSLQESVPFFDHVLSEDQVQVTGLCDKRLYLLTPLTNETESAAINSLSVKPEFWCWGGGESDTTFDQTVCVPWWLRGQGVAPLPSFGVAVLGSLDISSLNWEAKALVRRWVGKEMDRSLGTPPLSVTNMVRHMLHGLQ